MKLTLDYEDETKMRFGVSGASVGFANLLRRYFTNQVPLFAIDTITVYENTSSLFDEYIANRIGLVPLKMASGYKPGDEVLFTLDAHGPSTVYSEDLKNVGEKIRVANERIPLLKLLEEQNLRLEAKARMGVGRKHAKFQLGIGGYEIDGGQFKFKVETFQQLTPRDGLVRACEIVEQKCDDFIGQLGEIGKAAKPGEKKKD